VDKKKKKEKSSCCSKKNLPDDETDIIPEDEPSKPKKTRRPCMIYQDSTFKIYWEVLITLLLLFVCAVLPLNMALKNETYNWCTAYYSFDVVFVIDLILNFFITHKPDIDDLEVDDREKIARAYLNSWFPIDVMSIIPVDPILDIVRGEKLEFCSSGADEAKSGGLGDANMLFRGPKLAKIFRIIRLLRMIKLIKLMKKTQHLQSTF